MNRIVSFAEPLSASPALSPFSEVNSISKLKRRRSQRATVPAALPHATFAPLHYERGYAYPLIVWLHGKSASEQQLRRIMPHVSMRNFVAIAPRGAVTRRPGRFNWRQDADCIEQAEDSVFDCIQTAGEQFHVHPDRVFLVGSGTGGTMAMRIAWNHPERFAGAASLGGSLPTEECPLRRVNELRSLPCMLAMSRMSKHYPESSVCRDLRLLHSAGCTVALRQYPGKDDLTTGILSDLNCWLMDIVCAGK